MEQHSDRESLQSPILVFNHYGDDSREGEAFVTDHIFSYIVSGTQEVWSGNQTYVFKAGDYRFFKRNQLTKYVKRPGLQGFQSIAVHIDQGTLRELSDIYNDDSRHAYRGKDIALLTPHPLLENYVNTLCPYFHLQGNYGQALVALKARELVLLLLTTHPLLKHTLFDFSDPGKIDLAAFMNTHYRYNVGLDRMAFLTGRSLSTFKRDFQKVFHTTAGLWLTKKRLEEARFLITQKGKTASEIYLDLGFEDLSHFSFAYKKEFGTTPSKARRV